VIQSANLILTAALLICLLLIVALYAVMMRLGRRARGPTDGPECSKSRRTPLENLDSESISFLVKHPALNRTFVRELRRERRKVLREYLRSLRRDFNRTCAAIGAAMVESAEDRPDLAHAIFKQQVLFRLGLLQAECSMILEALGLVEVDFDGIIDALGSIRLKVTRLFVTAQHQTS
jgi:hypothetical protein